MSNNTYGLGGTEVKTEANEAIIEISQNKTLLIQKLTQDQPVKPDIVTNLTTVEAVFEHFKPEVEIDFEDADGVMSKETLKFTTVGDFGKKGITDQSKYLRSLDAKKEQYLKIMKQLRSNKILNKALADPEAKQALLDAIHSLLTELREQD